VKEMDDNSIDEKSFGSLRDNKRQIECSQTTPFITSILDIDQVVYNQIMGAKLAESALKDLEEETGHKASNLE